MTRRSGATHAAAEAGMRRRYATLPPATAGTLAYISDGATGNCADAACTTFGSAVTGGGGALKLLVWWDGTAWTLIGKQQALVGVVVAIKQNEARRGA